MSTSVPVTVFVKTPVVARVRNAANPAAAQPFAPGSLVSIFGTDLSDSSASADSALLPNELGGVSVTFNGTPAPLAFVSATQINAQVPWEALSAGASSGTATVVVKSAASASAPLTIPISAVSPAIFTLSDNQGAVLIASEGVIAAPLGKYPGSRPVRRGEYITVFCTGLGPVNYAQTSGTPALGDPLAQLPTLPGVGFQCSSVFCGDSRNPDYILYAGLAPGFVGLYQVNVRVYAGADTGDAVKMFVSIGTAISNMVTVAIEP